MHRESSDFIKLKGFYEKVIKTLERFLTPREYATQVSFLRSGGIKRKLLETTLNFLDCDIPFLPVLQTKNKKSLLIEIVGISMMRMIDFIEYIDKDGIKRVGTLSLNLNKIKNLKQEDIPEDYPYYIVGINLNFLMGGMSARKTIEQLEDKKQRPFTLVEVITLATHNPELLEKHDLLACGSEYKNREGDEVRNIPCIKLRNGIPTVMWQRIDEKNPRAISPSYMETTKVSVINSMITIIQRRPKTISHI